MTSAPVNISDAEVERLCLNFSGNNYPNEKYCGECGQSASLDENVIAVIRALRTALTAAESRRDKVEEEIKAVARELWADDQSYVADRLYAILAQGETK